MNFIFSCKSLSAREDAEDAHARLSTYEPLSDTSSARASVEMGKKKKTLFAERGRAKSSPTLPASSPASTEVFQKKNEHIIHSNSLLELKEKKKIYHGKIKIIRNIADGGFSRVYEVEGLTGCPFTGKMAMKELILASPSSLDNSNNNKTTTSATRRDKIQASMLKRITDEIEMFKKLSVHENVVKYFDCYVDEESNTVYILQELCDMNLKNCMQNQIDKINDKLILDWCRTLAKVLQYVHSQDIIHRDIKPANILFKRVKVNDQYKLVLKLCDFGLSKNTERSDAKTAVGSPAFIAPEVKQKSGVTYGNKCDIWSFAVLVYQLIGKIKDEFNLPDFERILQERPNAVENSKHLIPVLSNKDHTLHSLAVMCVNSLKLNPNERPTASDIVNSICNNE